MNRTNNCVIITALSSSLVTTFLTVFETGQNCVCMEQNGYSDKILHFGYSDSTASLQRKRCFDERHVNYN